MRFVLLLGILLSVAAQDTSKPSPASCCSNLERKPLRLLNHLETVEWLECNQIATLSIETVKRERVVGYELSLMTQEEMMELLGMAKIHAWRVARCKDVTDGTRRWTSKGQPVPPEYHPKVGQDQGEPASAPPPTPPEAAPAASPPNAPVEPRRGAACRYKQDLTGKRCFGFSRAPDPSWTPASCKQQCCRRANECGAWLYNYAEGCWFGEPFGNLNCRDEPGWFGAAGHV
eukprot:CAMPEP_0174928728 /NCGR_PEP_ID=MMETSP1355-20121228/25625_1 /TAXON_ID=464990 /ORGANISM="Hemiselmis tepida, Strain CCMP443" /LENGTH=230 /DNA_ID=CAMNT_0016174903 /DNA_START=42 /DNA_END=734 /DNA_ORIENTATION=+